MRRSAIIGILVVLVIIWLGAIVFLSGQPGTGTTPIAVTQPAGQPYNSGLMSGNPSGEPARFSIEEVTLLSPDYALDIFNGSRIQDIYYIVGKNVNATGSAATWMYGMKNASGSAFLILDEGGWRVLPVKDTFPDTAIDLGTLRNVDTAFRNNRDLVAPPGATDRQVEISGQIIRVTVWEGQVAHTYEFEAATGALITSP